MRLTVFTDGGSLNNPGPAASAYAIYEGKKLIKSAATPLGVRSNNFAEYTGLIMALEELIQMKSSFPLSSVDFYADSQLMVNQINGSYKVKHPDIKKLHGKVKKLIEELAVPTTCTHVLREKNEFVDSLVKGALGR